MDIAFIFVSLCYSLGATLKMLKAVLKKSREGGKGTKKDPGMTVTAMFYPPAELSSARPGLSMPWCSSACPRGSSLPASPAAARGAGAAALPHLQGSSSAIIAASPAGRTLRAVGFGCCPRNTESRLCVLCCQLLHSLGPALSYRNAL